MYVVRYKGIGPQKYLKATRTKKAFSLLAITVVVAVPEWNFYVVLFKTIFWGQEQLHYIPSVKLGE
jgi:hypothetical protein